MPLLADVAEPASGWKENGLILLLLLSFNKCLYKLEDKPWFRSFPAFLSFWIHFQQYWIYCLCCKYLHREIRIHNLQR